MDSVLTIEALRENLNTQLSELDVLQSMYCNPGEIKIEDTDALNDIKRFLSGADINPPYLDITVNLTIDSSKYEICVNLPHEYPNVEPDVFVRNPKLNKTQHALVNKELARHVSKFKGDTCIFSAISWLQDNANGYIAVVEDDEDVDVRKSEKLVRYWIYSHHIYSKAKKREILSLANALNITGFCMPGKPGIICVEGAEDDCSEWWRAIRSMTWKRIFCKITEDCKRNDVFLKFKTFEQISFPNNGVKGSHMDMGEFYKFLETNGCSYVFKDLLGVDNKCNS